MAGPDSGENGVKGHSNWRGKPSPSRRKSAARKGASTQGWQDAPGSLGNKLALQRYRWKKGSVAGFLFISLIGIAGLVYTLVHREIQLPIVYLVKTDYGEAFLPNAWAVEDLESLQESLAIQGGETVKVDNISHENLKLNSSQPSLTLKAEVLRLAKQKKVIVFYFSLHGVVNDEGQACLVFPETDPLESNHWLPISTLLDTLKNPKTVPADVLKFVIFDCNRQYHNEKIGLIENDFSSQLDRAIKDQDDPKLVVLNSTSKGQVGHSSPAIKGSIFGQFLRLGLAGHADIKPFGNGDKRVSLFELKRYLEHHVCDRAKQCHGENQNPWIWMRSSKEDRARAVNALEHSLKAITLTRSLAATDQEDLLKKFHSQGQASPSVSRTIRNDLWKTFNDLCARRADSLDPLRMGEIRNRLLWLEHAAEAGKAYSVDAIKFSIDLQKRCDSLNQELDAASSGEYPVLARNGNRQRSLAGLRSKLHSLPLQKLLGPINRTEWDQKNEILTKLAAGDSSQKLDEILADSQAIPVKKRLTIEHFAMLSQRSQRLLKQSESVGQPFPVAIQLHYLAETIPSDFRIQFWIEAMTREADVARRRFDDQLWSGNTESTELELVERAYHKRSTIAEQIRDAFQLTDLVMAELPDLVRWFDFQQTINIADEAKPAQYQTAILELITTTNKLADQLDTEPDSDSIKTTISLISEQYHKLKLTYNSLRKDFDNSYKELVDKNEFESEDLQSASELLALAISPKSDNKDLGVKPFRERLQALYSVQTAKRDQEYKERQFKSILSKRIDDSNKSLVELDVPRRSSSYHLLTLISHAESRGENGNLSDSNLHANSENSTVVGNRIRKILKNIPLQIAKAQDAQLDSSDQVRQNLSHAARLARLWAPLASTKLKRDPIEDLQKLDFQQFLLFQAERFLDDFWGNGVNGESPFFESAYHDSLDAARSVYSVNPATNRKILSLEKQFLLRKHSLKTGLKITAEDSLPNELDSQRTVQVFIETENSKTDFGLTPGVGMLCITDSQGEPLGPIVRFPIPLEVSGRDSAQRESQCFPKLNVTGLTDMKGVATTFFRGHEFVDDLVIKNLGGTAVEPQIPLRRTARVRLGGNQRQRASVVFVLDCSASMQTKTPFESPEERVSRMDIAKAALNQMLNTLAARGDARVGVLLYGHRVGWSTKQPNQFMIQPAEAGAIPAGLKPYEDVETILPLGRFDNLTATKIAQRLENVKPWGETPLYLSLQQALLEFKDDAADVQKSIVVITDGVNYQFNPRPEMAKTVQDVLNANVARRIPIYLVGFDIQAREAQQAEREFSRLARETGGQYLPVSEAASLADTLEGILKRRSYSAISATGVVSKDFLGNSIPLEWSSNTPQDYTITVDALSERIELTGGEAVELMISKDGKSMISADYEVKAPTFYPLLDGSQTGESGVRVGVHLPVHEGTAVTFDLSLQQVEQRFLRRPNEVWIEITPIFSGKTNTNGVRYIFYDAEFVPQTSVPVLRTVAKAWPKQAQRAKIEFWCKWSVTEPSLLIPFSQLPDPNQPSTHRNTVDDIPGFEYRVREKRESPGEVTFLETYSSKGETLVKVDTIGPIAPLRTKHQFDEANSMATHSFFFENLPDGLRQSLNAIRVVSRRRMLDGAWHVEEGMIVDVPSQSDTLPSSP